MKLEVLDFYSLFKVLSGKLNNTLMSPATLYILVKQGNKIKELSCVISKKYKFNKTINFKNYQKGKGLEYAVLRDYLTFNKEELKKRWELVEEDFNSVLFGLQRCLIKNYSNFTSFKKFCLLVSGEVKQVLHNLSKGIKK